MSVSHHATTRKSTAWAPTLVDINLNNARDDKTIIYIHRATTAVSEIDDRTSEREKNRKI